MPENYVVDLDNPDVFVLVEVFKVCRATLLSTSRTTHAYVLECMWCEHPEGLLQTPQVQRHDASQ